MGKEVCENCLLLQKRIEELERRMLAYENAHTPSSESRRNYPKREPTGNPVGAPRGHPGTTRPTPVPDKVVDVKQQVCDECKHPLGKPARIMKRIIEDIPEPQPVIVTQYNVHTYLCSNCAAVNIPSHPDLPQEGRFGKNLLTQIALLKYEDRLPLQKIADHMNRQYHFALTPSNGVRHS